MKNWLKNNRSNRRRNLQRGCGLLLSLCLCAGFLFPSVTAEAAEKKVSVYVMTTHKEKDNYGMTSDYSFTYDKNGLVKTCDAKLSTYVYTYSGKKLKKVVDTPNEGYDALEKETTTYTYDKKDRVKKSVSKSKSTTTTTTFSYDSKSRVKKEIMKIKSSGTTKTYIATYTYNKKGLPTKLTVKDGSGKVAMVTKYTYDKKGNPTKEVFDYGTMTSTLTNKYTYKSGRVTKVVATTEYSEAGYPKGENKKTYTYKKIKVPKSYQATIEEQQQKIFKQNVLQ